MKTLFSLPRMLFLMGCLTACVPVTPTFPVVTEEPGAPLVVESPYPPPMTNTPGPYPPPGYVAATATPDFANPPECQFPGGAPPEPSGPALADYVFSEPQVVMTHTQAIEIAGWLSDNQTLLITRRNPLQPSEAIETFNVQTGNIVLYGERRDFDGFKPIWLESEQAILYLDSEVNGSIVLRKIFIPNQLPFDLITNLNYSDISVSPNEQQLVFFTEIEKEQADFSNLSINQSLGQITLPPPKELSRVSQREFRSVWSPDGNRIAFYRNPNFYLVDIPTNQVCEVTFQGFASWAIDAKWSPNGRFIAMITTSSSNTPLQASMLSILDTITGEFSTYNVFPGNNPGQYFVEDITWEPNSRFLAVIAAYHNQTIERGLFLVDSFLGDIRQILPGNNFGGGIWTNQLDWSDDGSRIAINCPVSTEGRICLTTVSINNQ